MTDVWTSAGVLVGVGSVALTGWQWLDPVLALAVAANIVISGFKIVRASVAGLMDSALPAGDLKIIDEALQPFLQDGVEIHALRTRQSGARSFVSFHVLVPGKWSVHRGHHLVEDMEASVREKLPQTAVFTHLEPIDDPLSFEDITLDRETEKKDVPPGAG